MPIELGPGIADEGVERAESTAAQRRAQLVPLWTLRDGSSASAELLADDDGQLVEVRGKTRADVTVTCAIGEVASSLTLHMRDENDSYEDD